MPALQTIVERQLQGVVGDSGDGIALGARGGVVCGAVGFGGLQVLGADVVVGLHGLLQFHVEMTVAGTSGGTPIVSVCQV